MPDIKVINSKMDQVLELLGLKNSTPITPEQAAVLTELIEQGGNLLIDAFYEANIPNGYSFIIEDIGEGKNFKITVKKL